MRATRIAWLAVIALACAFAIAAGDVLGRAEYWLRTWPARRRLRRWREGHVARDESERAARARQCWCECHVARATCGPCCPILTEDP